MLPSTALSYVTYKTYCTATPKQKTLEVFGTFDAATGKHRPPSPVRCAKPLKSAHPQTFLNRAISPTA